MVKDLNVDHVHPGAIGEKSSPGKVSKTHNVSIEMGVDVGLKLGRVMTHLTLHYSIIVIWNM